MRAFLGLKLEQEQLVQHMELVHIHDNLVQHMELCFNEHMGHMYFFLEHKCFVFLLGDTECNLKWQVDNCILKAQDG